MENTAENLEFNTGNSTDWQEIKYRETYEQEIRGLTMRRAGDPHCKIEDLEGTLKNLYILDGADQGGRGPLQDIIMAATIAAYERFIAEWKLKTC